MLPTYMNIFIIYSFCNVHDVTWGTRDSNLINNEKAQYLYSFLENSTFFKSPVAKADRSRMNVVFRTGNDELDAKCDAKIKAAKEFALSSEYPDASEYMKYVYVD